MINYIKWPKCPEELIRYFTNSRIDGVPEELICIEECSELQKELIKILRNKGNRDHIVEELTDVFITLNTIRSIYGITEEEIGEFISSKCKRYDIHINK